MKTFLKFYAPEGDSAPAGGSSGGAQPSTSAPATASPSTPSANSSPITSPKEVFGDLSGEKTPAITATPPAEKKTIPPPPVFVKPPEAAANVPPPPTPAAGVTMTEEQLTRLAQSLRPTPSQPDINAPAAAMTEAQQREFDTRFNVFRATPEVFTSIMGFAPENPAQLKALETFAHGIVRQASAMTMYQVQALAEQRQAQLETRLSPVLDGYAQQSAQRLESDFYGAHPDLKDFAPLIVEITSAEKARGTKFSTAKEAIDFVANKARTLLGKGAPGTSQQPNVGQPQKRMTMPPTSMGGRLGGNSSPQTPASGPKSVFGDLDGTR